jgi:hypothetical protein
VTVTVRRRPHDWWEAREEIGAPACDPYGSDWAKLAAICEKPSMIDPITLDAGRSPLLITERREHLT